MQNATEGCNGSVEALITPDNNEATNEPYELAAPFRIMINGVLQEEEHDLDEDGNSVTILIDELCPGDIEISIVNNFGCNSEPDIITIFDYDCDNFDPEITLENMQNASFKASFLNVNTVDSQDGSITISSSDNNADNFRYSWSTGFSGIGDEFTSLENIATGIYYVTIEDVDNGCTSVEFYYLDYCTVEEFVQVGEQVVPYSEPPVTLPNYDFLTNPNPNTTFEIKVIGGLFFPDQDFVEFSVLLRQNGEDEFKEEFPSDFSIYWYTLQGRGLDSRNQTFRISKNFINSNGGSVNVNISVTNGCQDKNIESIQTIQCGMPGPVSNVSEALFIKDVVRPCGWLDINSGNSGGVDDGGFTVYIPNYENDENIDITVNGVDYSVFLIHGDRFSELVLSEIGAGVYNIDISVSGCSFQLRFGLIPRETDKEFVEFEGGNCVYIESCGDVYSDTYYENPQAIPNTTDNTIWGNCFVTVACRDDFRSRERISTQTATAWEYARIVDLAFIDGAFTESYYVHLQNTDEYNLQWTTGCERVKFCPYSFQAWNYFHPIDKNCAEVERIEPIGNGCVKVGCDCRSDFEWCANNINIPGFTPSQEAVNCSPIQQNIYEIWVNLAYFLTLDGFRGSELYDFLMENGNKSASRCADVIYCSSNFEIKYNDNLLLVDCEPYEIIHGDSISTYPICAVAPEGSLVGCWKENCSSYDFTCIDHHRINFNLGVNGNYYNSEQNTDELLDVKYFQDTLMDEELKFFGKMTDEDSAIPKGFIVSNGKNYFYDFDVYEIDINKSQTFNFLFYENGFYSEKTSFIIGDTIMKENIIGYNNDFGTGWVKTIKSDSLVKSKHLSRKDAIMDIGGIYLDSLNIDSSFITESNTYSAFNIKFDTLGNLLATSIIQNLDTTLVFSENQNGTILLASPYHGDTIIIDDTEEPMSVTDGLMIASIDANNQVEVLQTLAGNDDLELLELTHAADGSYAMALANVDSLAINGFTLLDTTEEQLVLLTFSNTLGTGVLFNALPKVQTFSMETINPNKLDLIYGKNNDLIVGLTFTDSLTVFGQNLVSNGLEDIALLKFNSLGSLVWHRTYGTEDNENVSQLMYDNTVVFFGGEFNGPTQTRILGNYIFINLTNSQQRAYISYVFDEIPTDAAVSRAAPTPKPTITGPVASDVTVYPNPFSNTFTISFDALQAGNTKIVITDMMGKEVHRMNYNSQVGKNEVPINTLKQVDGGVYYISVHREAENLQSSHKIIHIR